MEYLFDSSAIFGLVKEHKIELLARGHTISLAQYELGNIIWKEVHLRRSLSENEAVGLLSSIYTILAVLDVEDSFADAEEILGIAAKLGITFYDAAYLHCAKRLALPLITLDERLVKKSEGIAQSMLMEEMPGYGNTQKT